MEPPGPCRAESDQPTSLEDLRCLGWRQGSVLPAPLVHALRSRQLLPGEMADSDALIIISHDCDVTHARYDAEPCIELLLARPLTDERRDGNLLRGNNPRRLQFEMSLAEGPRLFEAAAHDRAFVDRRLLLGVPPDAERRVTGMELKAPRLWLAKRYVREAFPDAFNERLAPVGRALRERLKRRGQHLTGIYLDLTDEELPDDRPYRVIVIATMRPEDHKDKQRREQSEAAISEVEAQMAECKGVEVVEATVVPESEISLDDLRVLKRWDYDSLSLRTVPPGEMAPLRDLKAPFEGRLSSDLSLSPNPEQAPSEAARERPLSGCHTMCYEGGPPKPLGL